MSKAFTRESDDLPEQPLVARPASPGGRNFLTPSGAQRLRAELARLTETTDANALRADAQRSLELQQSLAAAEIVPPPARPWEQVLFGATVTVRDAAGGTSRYRIVGRDETDLDQNWISSTSPIARALLKARLGQRVRFRIPVGEQEWEIMAIDYE